VAKGSILFPGDSKETLMSPINCILKAANLLFSYVNEDGDTKASFTATLKVNESRGKVF